ncbi:MAG: futalosine hydrolase [Desulfonauticus sp.]|nr:futalosine hydrolase [Desulfonauticus sp.]
MPKKLLVFATNKELENFWGEKIRLQQGQLFKLNAKVYFLVTGISVLNSAFFLPLALQEHCFDLVINLGLAGSFSEQIPLGDIVLCKQEIWPEFGVLTEQGVKKELLKFFLWEQKQKIDNRLDLHPSQVLKTMSLDLPSCKQVVSLTVSTVTGTKKQAHYLKEKFQADIENMEGFALAYGCAIFKIPFLELRTISNFVGPKTDKSWDVQKAFKSLGRLREFLL